jgi:hypothetical protein
MASRETAEAGGVGFFTFLDPAFGRAVAIDAIVCAVD